MTSPDVIVVGASNVDLTFRAPRLPDAGETVGDADLAENLGGKGANQAVAAARLGADVFFLSSLGQDEAGARFERLLASEGIDASGCRYFSGQPTGRACIWLDAEGENRILVSSGANAFLYQAAVKGALATLSDASVVLCQLETPVEGVASAVAWAREVGALSIVNTAPALPLPRLRVAPDVLVANEHEAAYLINDPKLGPRDLAAALSDRFGVGSVVVTLGAAGALLWQEGDARHVEAPAVTPADTTGAGDAFCGAFAARLAAGDEPLRAVELACAAGALATLRLGAMSSLPTLAKVEGLAERSGPA
ncbi:MAG TPA: ribokinase [Solirubrobacterales bacterium]|nr:ribokinase [Solirubrobacterales bacterium]